MLLKQQKNCVGAAVTFNSYNKKTQCGQTFDGGSDLSLLVVFRLWGNVHLWMWNHLLNAIFDPVHHTDTRMHAHTYTHAPADFSISR